MSCLVGELVKLGFVISGKFLSNMSYSLLDEMVLRWVTKDSVLHNGVEKYSTDQMQGITHTRFNCVRLQR